jgi:PmbA protein
LSDDDLLKVATTIVDQAGPDEAIEAFLTHEKDFTVKVFDRAVESVSSAQPRGAGVRLITGNRGGFAFTTDLTESGLEDVVGRARENARHSTEDPALGVAEAPAEPVTIPEGMFDESQPSVSVEAKVAFAIELDTATRSADVRIRQVEDSLYADSDTTVAIATSRGVAGIYRRTDAWCYSYAIASEGDDTEVGFEFELARGLSGLDAEAVALASAERAIGVLGAQKIPSERLPVVLEPRMAGQFLGVLGSALTADAVQKGRSLFAGRIGEEVAAAGLSLVDDGRVSGGAATAPWDAEGVPTSRTEVISNGRLASFLYDLKTARREGRDSTGNASRAGFKSGPSPSPSNLFFESTGDSVEDVYRRAARGFLVQDMHGVHSGANPVSGDFSVGATGKLLENGDTTRAVKEVTIAAPMLDILRNVVAVADDRRWLPFGGSYGGATTLIGEMTVAGL